MEVRLTEGGEYLQILLSPEENAMLYSVLEYATREFNDRTHCTEEYIVARKLAKQLRPYVSWGEL